MYLLALSAVWLQGPSNGSPFTDAPLPFEQLKAPPDTAFDILMASLAMILLSAIAAGVFLGVSKLGAIEELLRKQAAKQTADAAAREERQQRALKEVADRLARGAIGSGGGGGTSAGKPDWLSPTVDRVVDSLERLERAQKAGTSQLANTLAAMASTQFTPSGAAAGANPAPSASREDRPHASDGADPSRGGSDETLSQTISCRITSFLEEKGYHDIQIVTPPEEIDAAFVHSGQVIVEARRDGVIHKGRVSLQNGTPAAVELRPSHSIFP
ncbi:hypothetical protein Poly30_31500 [Planctomycetes bacterium Poly30]|uniref:Uncharacterized protein n=1 Tax=Saltatorellus ferox TaxID=2528018 RepID=A0A518EU58_9BACT|nr:hypothetical protein Poly30_31500 [Planctomycetes bacterium Poly30]